MADADLIPLMAGLLLGFLFGFAAGLGLARLARAVVDDDPRARPERCGRE